MKFHKIESKKIYMEVIEQIRELVDAGMIKSGEQLPPERELAEELGISRITVRQALTVLEALGIVEMRHGEGTFIVSTDNFKNLFGSKVIEEADPIDILEARKIIETEISKIASERRTEEDLKALENLLVDMDKKIKMGEPTSTVDLSFHLRVAESTHNPVLISLMDKIASLMRESLWTVVKGITLMTTGRAEKYLKQHRKIYTYIKDGEALKAEKAMLEHLLSIEEDITGGDDVLTVEGGDNEEKVYNSYRNSEFFS